MLQKPRLRKLLCTHQILTLEAKWKVVDTKPTLKRQSQISVTPQLAVTLEALEVIHLHGAT
jgi:hypothetical protein